MLNSKIFREEISPDNPNGRLTPPGELVMAVMAVLVATREPVSTERVESILILNLPMNYEETKPSINN